MIKYSIEAYNDGYDFSELSLEEQTMSKNLYVSAEVMSDLSYSMTAYENMQNGGEKNTTEFVRDWIFPKSGTYYGFIVGANEHPIKRNEYIVNKAYEIKEKYAVGAIEGKYLDLLDNGYVFPDYSNKYFGYILKVNYYFNQGKKYFKLYIALGNGNINTVNFCLDDTNNKITRALKRYFKEMFSVDDLKFRLIKLQVENKISRNGKKYTEIQKCCIFDDDFEEELLQLNEQLMD